MDNIKFHLKIASSMLLRWLILLALGILLSSVACVTAFVMLGSASGSAYHGAHAGEAGAIAWMFVSCIEDPWVALLFISSAWVFPVIYFLLANKISLGFALFQLLENKLFPVIGDKVSGLLSAITGKQPGLLQSLKNVSALKERLADSAKKDGALNKVQRKAICYGLKKCRLDDVDFQQPNLDVSALLSSRVVQALQEAAQPTYNLLIWAVSVHAVLLVIAIVLNR